MGAFLLRFSRHVEPVGDPGVDPEHAGEIICLICLGNAWGSPRRSGGNVAAGDRGGRLDPATWLVLLDSTLVLLRENI